MSQIVYVITNEVTGMQYIGQTKHTAEERLAKHRLNAEKMARGEEQPNKYSRCNYSYLYTAMSLYGSIKFSIKELESILVDQALIIELETKWIKEYNTTVPNGYNFISNEKHFHPLESKDIITNNIIKNYSKLRTSDRTKGLPMFMLYRKKVKTNKTYEYWYILNHPLYAGTKSFPFHNFISNDDITGEESAKQACINFINELEKKNTVIKPVKPTYTPTPVKNGYMVRKNIKKVIYEKWFTDSKNTDESNKEQYERAMTYYNEIIKNST